MASKRIDILLQGKDNASGAMNQAANAMRGLASEANKAGSTISGALNKGITTAIGGFQSLANTASGAFSQIKAGAAAAAGSLSNMQGALAGLTGGFGLMQATQMAWEGATQRQFNQMYLATKLGADGAKAMIAEINKIVAAVPGDDTWMNALLSGAVAKQTNLTAKQLENLGWIAAKYVTAAQQTGASVLPINAQRELTQYIKTGNTSLMTRDGLLRNQIDKLEGIKTVEGRIAKLQEVMTEEGYMQLNIQDLASSKWEVIKGKIGLAAANVGMKLLPFVEKVLDAMTWLDEKTNGWATTIAFVGAAVGALLVAVIGVASVVLPAIETVAVAMGVIEAGAGAGAAAMGLLGVAAGPVGWIILGIVAAVAAAIAIWAIWGDEITAWGQSTYLWLEKIGQLIWTGDWGAAAKELGAGFQNAGQWIYSGLQSAGQAIYNFFANLPSYIGSAASAIVDLGGQLVSWLIEGLTSLSGYLDDVLTEMLTESVSGEGAQQAGEEGGKGLISGLLDWIVREGPRIAMILADVFMKLLPLIATIGLKIGYIIIIKIWEGIVAFGGMIGNAISSAFWGAVARAQAIWNNFKAWLWNNTVGVVVRVGIDGIQWVMQQWNNLKNWFWNNPIVQKVQAVFSGPGGPAGARGPGIGLHYEGYAGHQKNAWNASGTGLSGNCVDMTLGLMSAYGGSMVSGTWNGGAHVWWQSPSGQQLDPARKAIDGTWTPPARGPGNGNFGNIVINGDVYGYNDFAKKVNQATGTNLYKARRM